jgi:hypothetical protein
MVRKMKYEIVQTCGWRNSDGSPMFDSKDNVVIKKFKTYIGSKLWKFFNYDCIAEESWKIMFIWKIRKIDDSSS